VLILVTGASGFLGRTIAKALASAGHDVVGAVRDPVAAARLDVQGRCRYVAADFTRDLAASDWIPRLVGVDIVVNAVGILREEGAQTFAALHADAPRALFAACAEAGVRRVVQISALGADAQARSRYHLGKKQADDFLLQLPLSAVVVQPSLVYGTQGASAQVFRLLASLPVIPLPGSGQQQIQPVHLDDLVAAVVALALRDPRTGRIALVGPAPVSLQDYLAALRQSMRLGKAHFIRIPESVIVAAARVGGSRLGLPDRETLDMLERGNTAEVAATREVLGHMPRPVSQFIARNEARPESILARLAWLAPLLRASIALVWIVTGVLSVGIYPVAESYLLLAQVGVTGLLATTMLYGAGILDLGLGVATLALRRRRWLWRLQAAIILGYTLIITWKLPEFWLHPYGPILKNLPLLAAIWLLYELEER